MFVHFIVLRKGTCLCGYSALRWCTVLADGALKSPDDEAVDYRSLVLAQANLLAVVTAHGDKRLNEKAYSMVR